MSSDFARVFSSLRKEKGYSQKKAAQDLGISQALLSHYENGLREPRIDFLIKICRYYDVSADYLLGITGIKSNFSAVLEKENGGENEYFFALMAAFIKTLEEEDSFKNKFAEKGYLKRAIFTAFLDMDIIDHNKINKSHFSKEDIKKLCKTSMLRYEAMIKSEKAENKKDFSENIQSALDLLTDDILNGIKREVTLFENEILSEEIRDD